MPDHFKDTQKIQELLHEAQMGLWVLELNEGKEPRMYASSYNAGTAGFQYGTGSRGVTASGMTVLTPTITILCSLPWNESLPMAAPRVQYTWHHPKWGEIFIRCGGKRDFSYTEGVCLRGYHRILRNTFMLKKEYDIIIQTLGESYTGIFLCNLDDQSYKAIKVSGRLQELSLKYTKFGDFFRVYSAEEVAVPYRHLLLRFGGYEAYFQKAV